MGSPAEKPGDDGLTPTVLVVGAGAMGVLLAAKLSNAGLAVGVLDEWADGIRMLDENGACLEDTDGVVSCHPVRASIRPQDFPDIHHAIVLVKSWQTIQAARSLATCLHPQGMALTLQNGLGNRETLAQMLGEGRVMTGVTTLGANLAAPGRAVAGGEGAVVLEDTPPAAEMAALLRQAGLDIRLEADWQALQWDKLLVNAAINPITAVLGLRNGDVLDNPAALEVALAAAREAAQTAAALGIHLPHTDPRDRVLAVLRATAANRSSMLQDLQRGAPTEIEAITGALMQAAGQAGVETPVNRTLYGLVKALVDTSARAQNV